MKIINARSGQLQSIPLSLGESGRGRWFEEIKISNRPGQAPSGPDDVGYFIFGQEKQHVILTKSNPNQRGVLLRINTEGTYTRGTSGSVTLKGGNAKMLVRGEYAYGDAGRIGGGTDELWHVEGPSVFVVVICGGSYKGYGSRYLIVTSKFEVFMMKREELCQLIATDENPDITEVVLQYANQLHEDIQAALKVASELEEVEPGEVSQVQHFASEYRSIEQTVSGFGIVTPAIMGNHIGGTNGVQAGTLIPGNKALVALEIGPGGGKRYRFEKVSETGLTRLKDSCERPYTRESVLAMVESPDWHSAWINYKDGEATHYVLANAGGVHSYSPDNQWGTPVHTEAWSGIPAQIPTEDELKKFFGLEATGNSSNDDPSDTSMGDAFRRAGCA